MLLTLLVLVPSLYILGVIVHEGSHALAAIVMGMKVTTFRFWPSTYNGHFYFGLTVVETLRTAPAWQRVIFFLQPKITNIVAILPLITILARAHLSNLSWMIVGGATIAQWIDYAKPLGFPSDHDDVTIACTAAPTHGSAIRIAYTVIALVLGATISAALFF